MKINQGSSEFGILYVATGERFVVEAGISAQSAKAQMPGIPTILYTDLVNFSAPEFDEVKIIDNARHFFGDKIAPLLQTPFEKTLFLDTDTFVCAPIFDVFELLDRFDVALAHAPMRHDRPYPTPNCFAEMNSGVIAYRKNAKVDAMFHLWKKIYEQELVETQNPEIGDQVHLRRAIYESDVSVYILPPEYNFRSVMPGFAARQKVRIIHGRAPNMNSLEAIINGSTKMRLIFPSLDQFEHALFLDRSGRIFSSFNRALIGCAVRCKRSLFRLLGKR